MTFEYATLLLAYSYAFDGSGKVQRDKANYALATFANGKHYNADLNAAYNIGARFWVAYLGGLDKKQEADAEKIIREETGKSSGSSSRTSDITLSTLWQSNAQRCGACRYPHYIILISGGSVHQSQKRACSF
jgi:putative transposase